MPTLFIYNPEHDLALANGSENYTPSAKIRAMRQSMALLPAVLAAEGDAILLLDPPPAPSPQAPVPRLKAERRLSTVPRLKADGLAQPEEQAQPLPEADPGAPYRAIAEDKKLRILTPAQLRNISFTDLRISPWGWNPTIVATLRRAGVPDTLLPSKEALDSLRSLSHRRTAIRLLRELAKITPQEIKLPVEIMSETEAAAFIEANRDTVFKAPWSSSGHGIQFVTPHEAPVILPWIKGVIREQGSVIAEPRYERSIDWATEWNLADGKARFLGFSLFRISGRGKYHGNIMASQREIIDIILRNSMGRYTREDLCEIIYQQQVVLEKNILPTYQGPLGIDMLTTATGAIHPCVELNLRNTMGHIALHLTQAL